MLFQRLDVAPGPSGDDQPFDLARVDASFLRQRSLPSFAFATSLSLKRLPIEQPDTLPAGLSVVGPQGSDARVLRVALAVEAALRP
jgi:Asp-tRNA(Asn)/Glu-tRNA(Gln) amidotransferase A subunit family amidase